MTTNPMTTGAGPRMAHVAVHSIAPSLTNPRKHFDPAKLQELADSIAASGVHQPILLRPLPPERLHGTLRTLTDMAQNGCRWRKACALVIAEDLETSHQLTQDFPQIGLAAAPACQALAHDILNDRLHPDAIAGAEIYRETEGTTA